MINKKLLLVYVIYLIPLSLYAQEFGGYICEIKNASVASFSGNNEIYVAEEKESYTCEENEGRQECKEAALNYLFYKLAAQNSIKVDGKTSLVETSKLETGGDETILSEATFVVDGETVAKIKGSWECNYISEKTERGNYSWIARGGAIVSGGIAFYQFNKKNAALNEAENLEKKANSTAVSSTKTSFQNQAKDKRDEAKQLEQQQNLFLGITIGLVVLDLLFIGLDHQDDQRWENVNIFPEFDRSKSKLLMTYNIKF